MTRGRLVDALVLGAFRRRTRRFLQMEGASGLVPPPPGAGASYLYLHIPFCPALCPFCSFHRVQYSAEPARRYFAALREEIRRYHAAGHRFSGAYFGGGTPTIQPDELMATVALVRELFAVREVSVETNPHDLRREIILPLRAAGVTRLSVGVQSFDNRLLQEMGRLEAYGDSETIQAYVRGAAGVFPTLNVDLIFNLPDQTEESLARDLAIVRAIGANQVSWYPLMASPDTRRRMAATTGLPESGRVRRLYAQIVRGLEPEFAASSAWCFNRGGQGVDEYVADADHYAGLGSGAFGYLDGTMYATTFSIQGYARQIAAGGSGIVSQRRLPLGDQMRYALLLKLFALRLDRRWANARFGPGFFRRMWPELRAAEALGAVRRDARGWSTTARGQYWLLQMMAAFYESVNAYREAMRARVHDELLADPEIALPASAAKSA